jgi:outer membrane protein OmpA-like peptidoglycan-associated protein
MFANRGPIMRGVGLVAVVLFGAGLCVACDTGSSDDVACPTTAGPGLAIAVGGRGNDPTPKLDPQVLLPEVNQVIADRKYVTLIRVDGAPSIACAIPFDSDAQNPQALESDKELYRDAVAKQLGLVRAVKPQADPLSALSIAASTAGSGGTVMLIDSGLQTVTPLDFSQKDDLLDYATPDFLVNELRRRSSLPDLKGRKVILVGIGYTAPPQQPLSISRRTKLINIWRAIVTAAGAANVTWIDGANTDPAPSGVPNVTAVGLAPEPPITLACNTTSVLYEDSVGFVPDSTDYINPGRANEVLGAFATWLKQTPQAHVDLLGSIAHIPPYSSSGGLSEARADAVRDTLQADGVMNQITARGEGWGPYPTKTDPSPNDADQQRNRRVVVTISC